MPVTPIDFLSFAEQAGVPETEIGLRCAVSRAYYSAYLAAKVHQEKTAAKLPESVKGGVHARLIAFYQQGLAPESTLSADQQQRIAGLLNLSKRLRVKSDYHINLCVPLSDKLTAIKSAKEVMAVFNP